MSVTGLVVLLALLAVPYVALNLRRLWLGRSWAFTFCQVAKEWEQRDRAKRKPARAADDLTLERTLTIPVRRAPLIDRDEQSAPSIGPAT